MASLAPQRVVHGGDGTVALSESLQSTERPSSDGRSDDGGSGGDWLPQQIDSMAAMDNVVENVVPRYSDRHARLWGLLWSNKDKLRLNIPETIIFCNGQFHSCLFSSIEKSAHILKKTSFMAFDTIRNRFERLTKGDASNITQYIAMVQHDDEHAAPVTSDALGRVLQHLGNRGHAEREAPTRSHLQTPQSIDFYQVVRQYIHPYMGYTFTTSYEALSSPTRIADIAPRPRQVSKTAAFSAKKQREGGQRMRDTSNGGVGSVFNGVPCAEAKGNGDHVYNLHTEVFRFSERYSVLEQDRDYFDQKIDVTNGSNGNDEAIYLPDVLRRECERMTLAVVSFFNRVHKLSVKRLRCEFVQHFSKKLYLHGIEDAVFSVQKSSPKSLMFGSVEAAKMSMHQQTSHDTVGPNGINASVPAKSGCGRSWGSEGAVGKGELVADVEDDTGSDDIDIDGEDYRKDVNQWNGAGETYDGEASSDNTWQRSRLGGHAEEQNDFGTSVHLAADDGDSFDMGGHGAGKKQTHKASGSRNTRHENNMRRGLSGSFSQSALDTVESPSSASMLSSLPPSSLPSASPSASSGMSKASSSSKVHGGQRLAHSSSQASLPIHLSTRVVRTSSASNLHKSGGGGPSGLHRHSNGGISDKVNPSLLKESSPASASLPSRGVDTYKRQLDQLSDHLRQEEVVERMSKGMPIHPRVNQSEKDRNDFLVFHWRHAAREAKRELDAVKAEAADVRKKCAESVLVMQEAVTTAEAKRLQEAEGQQGVLHEFNTLRERLFELEAQMAEQEGRHQKEMLAMQSEVIGRDVNVRLQWEKEEKLRQERDERDAEVRKLESTVQGAQATLQDTLKSVEMYKDQLVYMQNLQDELTETSSRQSLSIQVLTQFCDILMQSDPTVAPNARGGSGPGGGLQAGDLRVPNVNWADNQQLKAMYDLLYWSFQASVGPLKDKSEVGLRLEYNHFKANINKTVSRKAWYEKRTELMLQAAQKIRDDKLQDQRVANQTSASKSFGKAPAAKSKK